MSPSPDKRPATPRWPLTYTYMGRPASLYIEAMAKHHSPRPAPQPATAGPATSGPVALVTGGGRGIGRLLALHLSQAGYTLGLVARSAAELHQTSQLIQASGGRSLTYAADVTNPDAASEVVEDIETRLGPVDLLINNAGILGPIGPAWEVDLADWRAAVDVNLIGTFTYTHVVLTRMADRRRGRIINITSQAGAFRWPVVSAYSVSKAAVIKLTENVAIEARRYGVSIFSVHPGLLPIGLSETALDPDARPGSNEARIHAWAQRQLAEGRGAEPEDAVEQILLLASGRFDELSGRHLSVHDDLDQVLSSIDDVRARELYVLGLHGLVA